MINTDQPIIDPNNDKLGRVNFAYEIAWGLVNSFKDNNESIVIGLSGNWGSGKSTLINFIIGEIEKISKEQEQEIIVLRFNPWMFTGQKELQNIFLKELLTKFKSNQAKLKNVSEKLKDFLGYLTWLKYVHAGAGEAVKDVKEFLDGINKEKDIAELKQDIDKLLIESKVKLYITIDDIDRLTPSEITDIFQLVKLNGNFANTIFLLAYDQKVVTQALTRQFGENGNKYIDKIVQVDYTIPNISQETIKRIFGDTLIGLFPDSNLKKLLEDEISSIKNQSFVKYFTSLRDVYRFTNSLRLRLSSVYADLNLFDFLNIEALRIFNYDAYNYIINNKEDLVAAKKDDFQNSIGIQPVERKTKIDSTEFDKLTKKILKELFDLRDWGFNQILDEEKLIKDRRAANKHFFDRYFNLQLGDFDIPEQIFEKFINDSTIEEKEKIIHQIVAKKNLAKFLRWVELKSIDIEASKIEAIYTASLNICETEEYAKSSYFGLGSDFTLLINFCNNLLAGISDYEVKRKIFLNRLRSKNGEYTFVDFFLADTMLLVKSRADERKIIYNYLWNSLYTGEKDDNVFFDEILQVHKDSILYLFRKYINDKSSLNDDEVTMLMPLSHKYFPDEFNIEFPKLIQEDKELLYFLWLSIKRVFVTSVDGISYQFAENQFLPGLDKEQIKLRLDKIDQNDLDNNETKILKLFTEAYNDGFKERLYYNIDNPTIKERL